MPILKKLRQYSRKCENMQEIATICKKLREYSRNCDNIQEIATIFKKLRQYARNCDNIQEIATIFKKLQQYSRKFRQYSRNWDPKNEKSQFTLQRRRIEPGQPHNSPLCSGPWCRWYHWLGSACACWRDLYPTTPPPARLPGQNRNIGFMYVYVRFMYGCQTPKIGGPEMRNLR